MKIYYNLSSKINNDKYRVGALPKGNHHLDSHNTEIWNCFW